MEYSGPTFKKLREGKGFSVSETAADLVTPQFLRKYEAGKCDISLTNFLSLLARINITLVEFSENFQEETFDSWLQNAEYAMNQAVHNSDTLWLIKLMEEAKAKSLTSQDIRYRLFYVLVKGVYNEQFILTGSADFQEIGTYLKQINTWSRFEYFLTLSTHFPVEPSYLKVIARDILQKKRQHSLDDPYARDFVVHLGLHFYRQGDLAMAKEIYEGYFKYSFTENNVDNLLFDVYSRYCQGIISATEGDPAGDALVQDIITFFDKVVGHTGYANRMNILYNRVKFQVKTKKA